MVAICGSLSPPSAPSATLEAASTNAATRFTVVFIRVSLDIVKVRLKGFQILDEIGLLAGGEAEREGGVVVIDDGAEGREPSVVIEAALLVREEPLERRGPIVFIGRALRLEIVDSDLGGGVHVPAPLGEQRRHVAGRALARPVEHRLAARGRGLVEAARRRGRRRD